MNDLILRLLHILYMSHGLKPFKVGASRSMRSSLFIFLAKYLAKNPQRYQELAEWRPLFGRYLRHGPILANRLRWHAAGPHDKICGGSMMCNYGACPWVKELLELPINRPLDAEETELLNSVQSKCCAG